MNPMKTRKKESHEMSKVKTIFFVVLMAPFIMNAEDLVENGDAESGYANWGSGQVQVVTENPHSGNKCFKSVLNGGLSEEVIPVDASKTYKLSAWCRSADDKTPNVLLGFQPLDANKMPIEFQHVNVVPDTETELAEACAGKDTAIKIKDGRNWKVFHLNRVAFDVDDTGELDDLPNRNISNAAPMKIEAKDAFSEVALSAPCGMDYPKGTKVRLHLQGDTYKYMVAMEQFNSPEWQELSSKVQSTDFYKGTKFIKIVFLALGGGDIYFDDIQFEEVK